VRRPPSQMTIVENNDNKHEWDFDKGRKIKLRHQLIKVKKCYNLVSSNLQAHHTW
jgi:hypothetical protein